MINVSYTLNLVLFTVISFPIFLGLLFLSDRKKLSYTLKASSPWLKAIYLVLISVELILFLAKVFIGNLITSQVYYLLSASFAFLLLSVICFSPESGRTTNFILFSLIVFHIILTFPVLVVLRSLILSQNHSKL